MIRKIISRIGDSLSILTDPKKFEDTVDELLSAFSKPINEDKYQHILYQANISEKSSDYMARSGLYALTTGFVVMAIIGLLMIAIGGYITLTSSDILVVIAEYIPDVAIPTLELPFDVPYEIFFSIPFMIEAYNYLSTLILENALSIIQSSVLIFSFFVGAIPTYLIRWYYPYYIIGEREREIDLMLPFGVTYMYAMTAGGRDVIGMLQKLADREDSYGEVSKEARSIINTTRLGTDIQSALDKHKKNTPSDEFRDFLDRLTILMQYSHDVDDFFGEETDQALDSSQKSIENKQDFLELINEFIIIGTIVPAFIIILAIVGQMSGGGFDMLLYAVIPMVLIFNGFMIVFISILFGKSEPKVDKLEVQESNSLQTDDGDVPSHLQGFVTISEMFSNDTNTVDYIVDRPWLSFIATIPMTLIYVPLLIFNFEMDMLIGSPVEFTLFYIFTPLFILFGLYTLLYEYKSYKIRSVQKELMDVFRGVSEANKKGIGLREAMIMETEDRDSPLSNTLHKNIMLTEFTEFKLSVALEKTANRYQVSRLRRTIRLLTDTIEQTGNVNRILDVINNDLRRRKEIDDIRKQLGTMTMVIMIMSSAILILVFAIVDIMLLTQFDELAVQLDEMDGGAAASSELGDIDTDEIRANMVYSSFISFFGVGLLSGLLRTNNISSGLKYSFILSFLTIIAFFLI